MPFLLPVAEDAAAEGELALAVDPVRGREGALLQPGRREHHLEDGARRILALDRPVEQREVRVLHHAQPRVAIDGAGEAIDLERGRGDHGQHVAVARVHHHDGARLAVHQLLGDLLHAAVDRRHHLRARIRLGGLHESYGPAHRVHLDALAAVLAAQELVEQPLESRLAHHVAAAVPALLELLVVRLADVAEQVRGEPAVRVHALGLDLHDHAGQLELPLLHLLHVRDRQPAADPDGQKRVGRHLRDRVDELLKWNLEQHGQPAQGRVALVGVALQLARDERQRERGPVVDERQAVAVEEDAARRGDGPDADAVLVGGLLEAAALEDLQIPELADDDEQRRAHRDRHRDDALLPGVAAAGQPTLVAGSAPAVHEGRLRAVSAHASASTRAAPRKPL